MHITGWYSGSKVISTSKTKIIDDNLIIYSDKHKHSNITHSILGWNNILSTESGICSYAFAYVFKL